MLISNFVNLLPSILEVRQPSNDCILPFKHELASVFRTAGENSKIHQLFAKAIELALDQDAQDNDGLPDEDWAVEKTQVSPKAKRMKKSMYIQIVKSLFL